MIDIAIYILSTIGSIFILLASIGIFRMPDFYMRLSVTIKASTFGIGFILLAVALFFNEFSVTTKVMAILFFLIITAPVSGHLIGKTAYRLGIKLWDKSIHDDLKDYVDATDISNKKKQKKTESLSSKNKNDEDDENNENENYFSQN